jgi:hypothetical protein
LSPSCLAPCWCLGAGVALARRRLGLEGLGSGAVFLRASLEERGAGGRGFARGLLGLCWARLCCCARAARGRRGVRKTLASAVFLTLWGVPGACFPSPYPGLGAGVRFWCVVAVRALLRASGRPGSAILSRVARVRRPSPACISGFPGCAAGHDVLSRVLLVTAGWRDPGVRPAV